MTKLITKERILDLLRQNQSLKAKEIGTLLGKDIKTKDINSILYRELRGKVKQDSSYRWSLIQEADNMIKTNGAISEKQNTRLAKLASYYLECISKDIDNGISEFASGKYSNLDYVQLDSVPILDSDNDNFDLESIKHLINKVRREKNRLVLKLGYPIFLRRLVSRAGRPYFKVEPLFLLNIDTEHLLSDNHLRLTDEDPEINPEMLRNILGVGSSELLEEIIQLNDELGINNADDKPSLDDLAQRLEQIRPDWEWEEEINPFELSKTNLSQTKAQGIYNSCGLFVSERSQYTIGLEKELTELTKLPKSSYANSALGDWVDNTIDLSSTSDETLLEPLNLNEEQREAVLRGLSSSLTVVTGPPGTGKSQVVASLLVNAVYKGQKVLFASKNHKAVDVVFERVNGLTSRPVMLRLGNSELQASLSSYLTNLLASKTTQTDKQHFQEVKQKHDLLTKKINEIRKQQKKVIEKRNEVDRIEQSIESIRNNIGKKLFEHIKNIETTNIENSKKHLNDLKIKVRLSDKRKQSFFTKLFWGYFKQERINATNRVYSDFKVSMKIFKIKFPELSLNDSNINAFYHLINRGTEWLANIEKIKEYFNALESLNKMENLYELTIKDKFLTDEISENSLELWERWLQLMPDTISPIERKKIGNYVTLLNLIVKAETENHKTNRGVWAKYYKLLPEITNILSCWAVTSLSVRSRVPFESGFFDLVVIDEASQCDIASALPLLYRAKRAVIIGDNKQLTHISTINESQDIHLLEKHNLYENLTRWSYSGNSLFGLASSLCNSNDIVLLRDHHRSHADIINFSNKYFYGGNLRVATKYENLKFFDSRPVKWINVNGKVTRPATGSSLNEPEARAVVEELRKIVEIGYMGSIGVVTPFRAQANRIRELVFQNQNLSENLISRQFLVDTVHKFQGDERDIMIFSTVLGDGMAKGSLTFLSHTENLFNVAITRARASLIVVGDMNACLNSNVKHFARFAEYVKTLDRKASTDSKEKIYDFSPKYPEVTANIQVSDWEKILYEALYQAKIYTIPQYQVGQYVLDLALIKGERKLAIEVDGEKYHRNWDGELLKKDRLRNKRLIELGWDVKRFWVYQIRDDLQGCVKNVRSWMEKSPLFISENEIAGID